MQIKTVDTRAGKVFEFVRWEYDPERRRSKSTSLGRMQSHWAEAPEPILAKMRKDEIEEYRQFQKARIEAERLHKLVKSPEYAVEYLTACVERFRLSKDEKSQEQAVAIGSAVAKLYAVLVSAGYQVPWPERPFTRQIDLEEAIAAVVAREDGGENSPKPTPNRRRKAPGAKKAG